MAFKPAASSGGTNSVLGLWNAYNRVSVRAINRDGAGSWTYNSTTWRAMDASTNNRITYVDGLGQSSVQGDLYAYVAPGSATFGVIGLNLDSTSAAPGATAQSPSGTTFVSIAIGETWAPMLGLHYVQAMEANSSTTASTWFAAQAPAPARQLQALTTVLEMHLPPILPLAAFRRRRRRSAANESASLSTRAA
jgi:hypothetical protein